MKHPIEKEVGIEPDDEVRYPFTDDEGAEKEAIEQYFINPTEEEVKKLHEYARKLPRADVEVIREGTTKSEDVVLLSFVLSSPVESVGNPSIVIASGTYKGNL